MERSLYNKFTRETLMSPEQILQKTPKRSAAELNLTEVVENARKLLDLEYLSEMDLKFVSSVLGFWEREDYLTIKQESALRYKIDKYIFNWQTESDFKKKYVADDTDLRQRAKIAAKYYLENPPYFMGLAKSILSEPDFVPSHRQFVSMVENQYAKKAIDSVMSPPRYEEDQVVELRRASGNSRHPNHIPLSAYNRPCIIIKNDFDYVASAAMGAKIYEILPFGQTTTYKVEERHIKKITKNKKWGDYKKFE